MPAYDIAWRSIERAIDSILDQDYKNWELLVCHNGTIDNGMIWNKVEKYLTDKRIKWLHTEDSGACLARNMGAKEATGDIWSFFSSDFVMKPGGLRTWVEYFEDKPEVKMLYSGYDWTSEDYPPYPSQPYDEYILFRGYNYIDGGMPIRKEVFVPWDESLKSLNDYEWVINIIKTHKITPLYIPQHSYKADLPKPGGLSEDSSKNWKERIKYIKTKHSIPISPICCCSYGAPSHAIKMAKLLDADFNPNPMFKPNDYKLIYLFGFYVGTPESVRSHCSVFGDIKNKEIKKAIHWIGSDIQGMYGVSFGANRQLVKFFKDGEFIHLAEFGQTASELLEMSLVSKIIPLPVEVDKFKVVPKPDKPVIAIYHPDSGNPHYADQYNIPLMYDIIESMPDIEFKLYGGTKQEKVKDSNVELVGKVDMPEFIKQCSMLLRVTIHDGLPISVVEFVLGGREVITSINDMPGTWYCGNGRIDIHNYHTRKEEIISMIRTVLKDTTPQDTKDKDIEYWKNKCDPKVYKKDIEGLLNA